MKAKKYECCWEGTDLKIPILRGYFLSSSLDTWGAYMESSGPIGDSLDLGTLSDYYRDRLILRETGRHKYYEG